LDAKRGWRYDNNDQREWQPGDTDIAPQASSLKEQWVKVHYPGQGLVNAKKECVSRFEQHYMFTLFAGEHFRFVVRNSKDSIFS